MEDDVKFVKKLKFFSRRIQSVSKTFRLRMVLSIFPICFDTYCINASLQIIIEKKKKNEEIIKIHAKKIKSILFYSKECRKNKRLLLAVNFVVLNGNFFFQNLTTSAQIYSKTKLHTFRLIHYD